MGVLREFRRPRVRAAVAAAGAVLVGMVVVDAGAATSPRAAGDERPRTLLAAAERQRAYAGSAERLLENVPYAAEHPSGRRSTDIPLFDVTADGRILEVPARIPDGINIKSLRGLADGRVVVDGLRTGERESRHLLVLDAEGDVISDRVVRRGHRESVRLLGVTGTTAVFRRARTNSNRVPIGNAAIVVESLDGSRSKRIAAVDGWAATGDFAGNRIVVAGSNHEGARQKMGCWVESVTAASARREKLPLKGCEYPVGVNVSPDGRFAAVSYMAPVPTADTRLAMVDLRRMRLVEDTRISTQTSCDACQVPMGGGYVGMAWTDETTLRVARLKPIPYNVPSHRIVHALQDALRIKTFTAPKG